MRINAILVETREFVPDSESCSVTDIVSLSKEDYTDFTKNLSEHRAVLESGAASVYCEDGKKHCLLVLGEENEDGVLLEFQSNTCAFLPQARTIVQNHMEQLANYIIGEGTAHTEDGRWEILFEELYVRFGACLTAKNGNCILLTETLRKENKINGVTVTKDGISVDFKPEYCVNLQKMKTEEIDTSQSHNFHAIYGAGLNLKTMKNRCPNAELVGVGELKGYELQFHGQQNNGRLTAVYKPGSAVPIAVWKVPTSEEKKFLEVTENSIRKIKSFDIQLGNGYVTKANCYFEDIDYPIALPTKSYYWDIYQGYLDHGFDVNILNNALKDCTLNFYTKSRGFRVEQISPYESNEEESLKDTSIGQLIVGM